MHSKNTKQNIIIPNALLVVMNSAGNRTAILWIRVASETTTANSFIHLFVTDSLTLSDIIQSYSYRDWEIYIYRLNTGKSPAKELNKTLTCNVQNIIILNYNVPPVLPWMSNIHDVKYQNTLYIVVS